MKNKFQSGIQRIVISVSLAFIGPVLFVLGSNPQSEYHIQILLIIAGGLMMLGSMFFGFTGIKKILSYFFDDTNE